MGFEERFDFGEAAGTDEAADGEFLRVAGCGTGELVFGDGGVDRNCFVRVIFCTEPGYGM